MGVSLRKGGNVSLSKEAPGLKAVMVGLGWDEKPGQATGFDFDLDAMCFLLAIDGKVRDENDFVFYSNLNHLGGYVIHQGDNLTGEGEGDDEQILMNLADIPLDIDKIVIVVDIFEANKRNQNFGQVENAFIRIVNVADNNELARFDLSEDFSLETGIIFGEIYRHGNEWKFKAVAQGWKDGMVAMCAKYGINASA